MSNDPDLQDGGKAILQRLRGATEQDVEAVLQELSIAPVPTPAHLLEFFNRMVDLKTFGIIAGGDSPEE